MKGFKLLALGITASIMLAVGAWTYAYVSNANRVNDVSDLVSTIQGQRIANTFDACADQNTSNTRIKRQLKRLVPNADSAQRETIQKFASAISPRQNCINVVKAKTGTKQSKK